jgi:mRNA-degrading endonuclease toxin of MazEF toxin-antitoxin module
MILFRDGDDVRYFVVRGVMEGDRRVIRCDMVKVMDWDRLIEYLGDVWEELWDATLFKLKAAEASMP